MRPRSKAGTIVRFSVCFVLLFLGALLFAASFWCQRHFGFVPLDQLIFTFKSPMEGANTDEVVTSFLVECLPVSLAAAVILVLLAVNWVQPQKTVTLWLFHKPRTFGVFPFLLYRKLLPLLSVAALVAGIGYGAYTLYIPEFIESQLTRSTLFEEAYVDPRSITLTFPEEKRNLVYIYLESMESTYLSKELGGNQEENLLPNLSELALANLNFSHTDTLGGARQVTGTSWTIAAMVSQTTGVPLKIPVGDNDYGNKSARFLPGVWSLGDILEQEGYRQELLIGSDASFGGRRQYFAQHGGYNIWDYYTARETGKIDPDYRVWWGYEDLKLFDYAREELTALAAEGEPFNFTMLTVDTHFPSGYVCPACWQDDERQYANVISCSDRLVADFVWWIQQQDFYENTTIILVGDHLSMDSRFFVDNGEYVRTTFNTIINAPMDTAFDKERMFTTLDWFPTTLASLGVEIPGERLGLGTNLFSGQPTLAESMGLEALDDELKKVSNYYNKHFLYGSDGQ
ncbi:LTA synthase family protein [Anaeromassilibacillus sp. SJQ-5]